MSILNQVKEVFSSMISGVISGEYVQIMKLMLILGFIVSFAFSLKLYISDAETTLDVILVTLMVVVFTVLQGGFSFVAATGYLGNFKLPHAARGMSIVLATALIMLSIAATIGYTQNKLNSSKMSAVKESDAYQAQQQATSLKLDGAKSNQELARQYKEQAAQIRTASAEASSKDNSVNDAQKRADEIVSQANNDAETVIKNGEKAAQNALSTASSSIAKYDQVKAASKVREISAEGDSKAASFRKEASIEANKIRTDAQSRAAEMVNNAKSSSSGSKESSLAEAKRLEDEAASLLQESYMAADQIETSGEKLQIATKGYTAMLSMITQLLQNGFQRDSETVEMLFQAFTATVLEFSNLFTFYLILQLQGFNPAGGNALISGMKKIANSTKTAASNAIETRVPLSGPVAKLEQVEQRVDVAKTIPATFEYIDSIESVRQRPIGFKPSQPSIKPIESGEKSVKSAEINIDETSEEFERYMDYLVSEARKNNGVAPGMKKAAAVMKWTEAKARAYHQYLLATGKMKKELTPGTTRQQSYIPGLRIEEIEA